MTGRPPERRYRGGSQDGEREADGDAGEDDRLNDGTGEDPDHRERRPFGGDARVRAVLVQADEKDGAAHPERADRSHDEQQRDADQRPSTTVRVDAPPSRPETIPDSNSTAEASSETNTSATSAARLGSVKPVVYA